MKRSLLLLFLLLCGIYLILIIVKGDVTNGESSEISPQNGVQISSEYFDGVSFSS